MKEENPWLPLAGDSRAAQIICLYAFGQTEDNPPVIQSMSDLRSCRLMLERNNDLRSVFPRVASASKEWANIVNFWDDICVLHDLEDPDWREKAHPCRQTIRTLNRLINKQENDQ